MLFLVDKLIDLSRHSDIIKVIKRRPADELPSI